MKNQTQNFSSEIFNMGKEMEYMGMSLQNMGLGNPNIAGLIQNLAIQIINIGTKMLSFVQQIKKCTFGIQIPNIDLQIQNMAFQLWNMQSEITNFGFQMFNNAQINQFNIINENNNQFNDQLINVVFRHNDGYGDKFNVVVDKRITIDELLKTYIKKIGNIEFTNKIKSFVYNAEFPLKLGDDTIVHKFFNDIDSPLVEVIF